MNTTENQSIGINDGSLPSFFRLENGIGSSFDSHSSTLLSIRWLVCSSIVTVSELAGSALCLSLVDAFGF